MVNGPVGRAAGAMQTTSRSTRPGEFANATDRRGSEDRLSNGASLTQRYGASSNGVGPGIWGNGSLGTFGSGTRDSSRSRENGVFLNTSPEVIDGKTGSAALVASSERDTWSRQKSPWTQSDLTLKTNNARSSGVSPVRSRIGSQGFPEIPQSAQSYHAPAVNFPVGQPLPSKPVNQGVLDATPGALATSRQIDSFTSFGRLPDGDGQRSATSTAAVVWNDNTSIHSPTDERRSATNSDYLARSSTSASRSGSLPPSRHGAEPFAYNQSPEAFNHFPAAQGPSSARAHNPSISSQGGWSGKERKDSIQGDTMAALGRLNLDDANPSPSSTFHKPSLTMNGMYQQPSFNPQNSLYPRQSSLSIPNGSENFEDSTQDYGNYTTEGFESNQLAGQLLPYRGPPRPNERQGFWTPNGVNNNTYRQPSYYSTGTTPPAFDHLYPSQSQTARMMSSTNSELLERKLRGVQYQQEVLLQHPLYQQMQAANNFRNQFGLFPYNMVNGMQLQGIPQTIPMQPMQPMPDMMAMESAKVPREQDYSHGIRSTLMEEFKSNTKTSKRYELKDIYDHFVEFSGDQHGSRFIQQKLETANSDEKERVFREIQPNALQLMKDVFGNYVIQKFFEHGDQNQKKILANTMKGRVVDLSTQMYGCRVVQKALEHVLTDQQASLVSELNGSVMKCVKDQNGNHVIQRAIQVVPAEHVAFIIDAFKNQVQSMAVHPYGCRVIQRMLEHCDDVPRRSILIELRPTIAQLLTDQYGNYVSQHILKYGDAADRAEVINMVKDQLLLFSKHKHASNVVEHCLKWANPEQKRDIMLKLIEKPERGESLLAMLLRDGYGNYVIQTLLDTLPYQDYILFTDSVQPELAKAKRTMAGKQIQHIEQKMHRFERNDINTDNSSRPVSNPPAISTDIPLPITSTGSVPEQTPSSNATSGANDSAVSEPMRGKMAPASGITRENGSMSAI